MAASTSRLAVQMQAASMQQAELQVEADLKKLEGFFKRAQDHANRQASCRVGLVSCNEKL